MANKVKKRGRVLKPLLIIILLLAVIGGGIITYVNLSAKSRILTMEEAAGMEADCALVLGCGVRADGTPSLMLRDRLDRAVELYENGAVRKLLMSGDHSKENYDEVNAMKDYAIAAGVPSEDVFMDHAGFSTYESAVRAKEIFKAERIIVVTQKYHLPRALYDARHMGLDASGVAAEDVAYRGQAVRQLREFAAQGKDFFMCIFKPDPTFLGEPIPVSGSGDQTNDR